MAEPHSPLEQFEVKRLDFLPQIPEIAGYNIDFTNASLFMVIAVLAAALFFHMGIRRSALVPDRMQSLVEIYYEFIGNMVRENIGTKGRAYFPFIFTLFTFLVFANLLGMIPGGFTVTSHIAVTFTMAILIFIGATIIGFIKHGAHFLHLFVPSGAPAVMMIFLVPIELMSYLARPITLSLRLAGNMMAGHVLLKVVAGFIIKMSIFGVLPLALLVAFVGFEFLVAVLQAYVFALLVCIYLNDAINMH
ncbi:MAG: F0F1 ATP synthase subunit A [Alphaproteobacteria bacterium]|nr:F0F1 ATP synthase subunit A [Alphaproteobacteria bacterium]